MKTSTKVLGHVIALSNIVLVQVLIASIVTLISKFNLTDGFGVLMAIMLVYSIYTMYPAIVKNFTEGTYSFTLRIAFTHIITWIVMTIIGFTFLTVYYLIDRMATNDQERLLTIIPVAIFIWAIIKIPSKIIK